MNRPVHLEAHNYLLVQLWQLSFCLSIFVTSNIDLVVSIRHKIYLMQRILIHKRANSFVGHLHPQYAANLVACSVYYHIVTRSYWILLGTKGESRSKYKNVHSWKWSYGDHFVYAPGNAYMCQWSGLSLIQANICRLLSDKTLSEPILTYHHLGPQQETSVEWMFDKKKNTAISIRKTN